MQRVTDDENIIVLGNEDKNSYHPDIISDADDEVTMMMVKRCCLNC